MSIYIQLAVAAMLFAAGLGTGWQTRDWKADSDELASVERQRKLEMRQRDKIDVAATAHEVTRAAAAERERVVVKEVERVVQRPVYRNGVCLDDDGLRIIAADIAARTGGQPAPALRAASAPR